ncbi:uncharacterized protein PHA67_012785 [Liasis olivaceus]
MVSAELATVNRDARPTPSRPELFSEPETRPEPHPGWRSEQPTATAMVADPGDSERQSRWWDFGGTMPPMSPSHSPPPTSTHSQRTPRPSERLASEEAHRVTGKRSGWAPSLCRALCPGQPPAGTSAGTANGRPAPAPLPAPEGPSPPGELQRGRRAGSGRRVRKRRRSRLESAGRTRPPDSRRGAAPARRRSERPPPRSRPARCAGWARGPEASPPLASPGSGAQRWSGQASRAGRSGRAGRQVGRAGVGRAPAQPGRCLSPLASRPGGGTLHMLGSGGWGWGWGWGSGAGEPARKAAAGRKVGPGRGPLPGFRRRGGGGRKKTVKLLREGIARAPVGIWEGRVGAAWVSPSAIRSFGTLRCGGRRSLVPREKPRPNSAGGAAVGRETCGKGAFRGRRKPLWEPARAEEGVQPASRTAAGPSERAAQTRIPEVCRGGGGDPLVRLLGTAAPDREAGGPFPTHRFQRKACGWAESDCSDLSPPETSGACPPFSTRGLSDSPRWTAPNLEALSCVPSWKGGDDEVPRCAHTCACVCVCVCVRVAFQAIGISLLRFLPLYGRLPSPKGAQGGCLSPPPTASLRQQLRLPARRSLWPGPRNSLAPPELDGAAGQLCTRKLTSAAEPSGGPVPSSCFARQGPFAHLQLLSPRAAPESWTGRRFGGGPPTPPQPLQPKALAQGFFQIRPSHFPRPGSMDIGLQCKKRKLPASAGLQRVARPPLEPSRALTIGRAQHLPCCNKLRIPCIVLWN